MTALSSPVGAVFRNEPVTRRIILAIMVSYLGVALVVWKDSASFGDDVWIGSGLVFASAVAYAYYLSSSQGLIIRLGSPLVTSYVLVVACLCVLLQFGLEGHPERLEQPAAVYVLGVATGLLSPYCLHSCSRQASDASEQVAPRCWAP